MKPLRIGSLLLSLLITAAPVHADEVWRNPKPFGVWLEEFRQEAADQGISQATLEEAFTDTAPIERVIELDRKQPETILTFNQYLARMLTERRVEEGRLKLAENRLLLEEIGEAYGVPPRFIVALWGVETSYGSNTGGFDIIDALATLAYDGRRSDYFRKELMQALIIADQQHIATAEMYGSWAGAMGQCQFMPTSFLTYAVDYDQDGRRDIWSTEADVFASIANYLSSSGWKAHEGWGDKVTLPAGFDRSLADIKQERPVEEWYALGVRKANGRAFADPRANSSLIFVGDAPDAPAYVIYGNYKVLLKWNRSRYFATAVGMLADRIGNGQ